MDWLVALGDSWRHTLQWLVGLSAVFALLVYLMPCNPGMFWWKDLRGVTTDFIYWLLMPIFVHLGRTWLLLASVKLLLGDRESPPLPVGGLPIWLQCLLILLIQDVLMYAIHRFFHTRRAWRFHAVHHSPQVLDWTATIRFHPVNNFLSLCVPDVIVLLAGFSPLALVVLSPINTIYSAMVHANLRWTFGPLRYVLASPVFHRWHHTTLEEGLDRNFASTFPFLDLMFGTFYMPPGRLPERFGNGDADFPEDFWGQMAYPFRKKRKAIVAAPEAGSEQERQAA